MLEFNPNSKSPPILEYATYVPGRTTSPKFKIHKRRGDALLAITDPSILYRFVDGEWKEIFRLENYIKPTECESCGASVIHEFTTGRSYNNGERRWYKQDTNDIGIEWVCRTCKRKKINVR